jgi:excisionase family DNA binding protein
MIKSLARQPADASKARYLTSAARSVLGRRATPEVEGFAPLIDAKAAGRLLGVPHTWLLAQARAGRIPHHRLGHYVRFDAADLRRWLQESRRGPQPDSRRPFA